jgi:acetyltransferase-like isoleucine patch superfamily enzyme
MRYGTLLNEEFGDVFRLFRLGRLATMPMPANTMSRTRARTLRALGWPIGDGTVMMGTPKLSGSGAVLDRLSVGEAVFVNIGAIWDLSDEIHIGDRVSIGQGVGLLTSSHEIGSHHRRADEVSSGPIHIGPGTWLGAFSTILPDVTIGAGALVAANSLVRADVAPNTLVGGVPARFIRQLDDESDEDDGSGPPVPR